MNVLGRALVEASLRKRLTKNQARRAKAVLELAAARHELGVLVREGHAEQVPMTRLAEWAGIRRERCYDLLTGIDRRHRDVYDNEEAVQ